MKTTIQLVNMLIADVKRLAKAGIISKVSAAEGRIVHIWDQDYEFKIAAFEKDHDSAISTIGVGVMPNWNDAQCKQVFPRLDICSMNGEYIDIICVRTPTEWIRYKVLANTLFESLLNGQLTSVISEISAANIVNAAMMCGKHLGCW